MATVVSTLICPFITTTEKDLGKFTGVKNELGHSDPICCFQSSALVIPVSLQYEFED